MLHCDPTLSLKLHGVETSDNEAKCLRQRLHSPCYRHCTINMILKLLLEGKKKKKKKIFLPI